MFGRINARRATFFRAQLFGRTVLYTPNLVDRRTVPKGMKMYELRADDMGKPCEIAHSFVGPKYGTIITHKFFSLRNGYRPLRKNSLSLDSEETSSLREFMREFPPKNNKQQKFGE